jgi:hypothetical protein
MPTLYAYNTVYTSDGYINSPFDTDWATCRDATTGASLNTSLDRSEVSANRFAGRGGGTGRIRIRRHFFWWNTVLISGTVSDVDIKLYGYSGGQAGTRIICVKSTAYGGDGGTALATSDFNAISGWSAGSSLDGLATDYSDVYAYDTSGWSTTGYNTLTGTTALKNDMKNNSYVIMCIMEYDYDYKNVALSTSPDTNSILLNTIEATGTSKDPYLDYTLAPSGYANTVKGVAAANIGKVKGVATANISKVIGI